MDNLRLARRIEAEDEVTPRFYQVLQMAIEEGIARGYTLAYKYQDDPPPDRIKEQIYDCVMGSLHEWFEMPKEDVE